MNSSAQPQIDGRRLEEARQKIDLLIKRLAHLAEQDLPAADFYGPLLQGVLETLAPPAGVVWGKAAQGNLSLQYQINLRQVGLSQEEEGRRSHDLLLHQAVEQARPLYVMPHSSAAPGETGQGAAGNPTDYPLLVAPVRVDGEVRGLVEIWQRPDCLPNAVPGFMQFLMALADIASIYLRNQQRRRMVSQEQLWTQLEALTLQIQASLNPTEVAYLVANEGRRLIECDRLSVAVRYGRRTVVEAISGVDVVEKRSKQVRLIQKLCQRVLAWGETLVFRGAPDDGMPPGVMQALDRYLEESTSKLLVVMPMRDPREEESKKPPRSVLVMESFEPAVSPEQLQARLEVVGKHATRALYNATQYNRIPLSLLWRALAHVQEGIGGKARAIIALVGMALVALAAAMIFVPYPLKMEAKGHLLPEERRLVYSPVEAHVIQFHDSVQPGSQVVKNQSLVLMYDLQLELKMDQLAAEIENAQEEVGALAGQLNAATTEAERRKISALQKEKEFVRDSKREELLALRERTNADETMPGRFWLKSPFKGTILSWNFREDYTNRYVKPSEPLLRIGDKDQRWEIELKIPQKHIGQVLKAFDPNDPKSELDVDLLVLSVPTRTFKGKLARDKVAAEAVPNREDLTDSEPTVLASVRIDGPDIPPSQRIPHDLLVPGTEVHTKIRCGQRAMGYTLFYGVWEFLYDKVVFSL